MNTYSHYEVLNSDVRLAFERNRQGQGRAGRVVSGLLKAAEKAGRISKRVDSGRVTGYTVFYEMTAEQLAAIRAEAVARARAVSRQALRGAQSDYEKSIKRA